MVRAVAPLYEMLTSVITTRSFEARVRAVVLPAGYSASRLFGSDRALASAEENSPWNGRPWVRSRTAHLSDQGAGRGDGGGVVVGARPAHGGAGDRRRAGEDLQVVAADLARGAGVEDHRLGAGRRQVLD